VSGGPFDGKAVITGAGKSQVGRRLGRTGLDLTLEAVLRAIEDAGLNVDDVDGIASYPGPGVPDLGFSGATVQEVRNSLGLRSRWFVSATETAGQIGPVIEACMAVTLGWSIDRCGNPPRRSSRAVDGRRYSSAAANFHRTWNGWRRSVPCRRRIGSRCPRSATCQTSG